MLHVITMLNGVLDSNFKFRGEPEFMEEQIRNLVKACFMFSDRVYLATGDKFEVYGYAQEWDSLVSKKVNIARSMGVAASSAAH